jgi:hypothetical protein
MDEATRNVYRVAMSKYTTKLLADSYTSDVTRALTILGYTWDGRKWNAPEWWYADRVGLEDVETAPAAPPPPPDRSTPIYGEYDEVAGF